MLCEKVKEEVSPAAVYYRRKKKNSFLSAGIPLVILVVSGSVLISYFLQSQVDVKGKTQRSTSTRQFDLEEEHRKLVKSLDIDNYNLSRIPRSEEEQEELKKSKKNKS